MKNSLTQLLNVVLKNLPYVVISVLLLIGGGLGYRVYNDHQEKTRLYEELIGKTEDYKQLSDTHAQLETKYATQEELRERLVKDWAGKVKRLEGQIKALAEATFEGGSDERVIVVPNIHTTVEANFCCDNVGDHAVGPAIARFRFETIDDISWRVYTKVLDHEIQIKAAITKNEETGQVNILAKAFWVQKENSKTPFNSWKDVPYPLNITGGSIVIDPTSPIDPRLKPRFMYAPHVNLGVFGGMAGTSFEAGGHVDTTLWGYGRTKNDLDFKFGGMGINLGDNYLDFNLVPVYYRIGNHLPLVEDLHIGPGVGFGISGVHYFLTLGTTL